MSEEKLNLFISYTHEDNEKFQLINNFDTCTAQLQREGLIEIWYDEKIDADEEIDEEIDENLENADIVCLFTSSKHIKSDYCNKEKNRAFELRKEEGISVINIIVSPCEWQYDKELSKIKALPNDGKPISKYADSNDAWHYIAKEIRKIVEKTIKIKQLEITDNQKDFLKNAEMIGNTSLKKTILLNDIFVYPELIEFDLSNHVAGKKINSEVLIQNITDYSKLAIAGVDQSGKTSLCKMIFKKLREKNFVPVYIQDKINLYKTNIEKTIVRSFNEQYHGANIKEIDKKRIIPIIDDFHYAENNERHIKDLSKNYDRFIIIIDDIYNINISDKELLGSFRRFQIRELKSSLRYELVNKWVSITEKKSKDYKNIDEKNRLINSTLGKTMGTGIMPSHPFFILLAMLTYETYNKEITSQGYCYQALIYFYLRKKGVAEDEIDTYLNFLTELSYYYYKKDKSRLTPSEFNSFFEYYKKTFVFKIKKEVLIENLDSIILVDGCNYYSFKYNYLYYFFVAKYFADKLINKGIQDEIDQIIENLHLNKNAYIIIFLAHHSRNDMLLHKIGDILNNLFNEFEPATLKRPEVHFFDKQRDLLSNAVMNTNSTPEIERKTAYEHADSIEELNESKEKEKEFDDNEEMDLRRAFKTSEVIGCIIKNRYGSLKRDQLEYIFKETMNLYLRILTRHFENIKDKEEQEKLIDFLVDQIKKELKKNGKDSFNDKKIKQLSKYIYWNISFIVVYSILNKIIQTLGSDKLSDVAISVCDKENTQASFIVKHGILMWFDKNPQPDVIVKRIREKDFSDVSNRVIRFMVASYCSLHQMEYRELKYICDTLKIPMRNLLTD